MTESAASPAPDASSPVASEATAADARPPRAPATMLMVLVCLGVFVALNVETDEVTWASLLRLGYREATDIWDGAYWPLITSAFVHLEVWHVAFNVYWLWVLGSRLERAIGTWRYAGFALLAAVVSSAFQLAVSDDTGIGASGVVYAIFGLMWQSREQFPSFREVVNVRTIQLFIVWLGGCMIATMLDIWHVGNAAHISGLLFGVAVAGALITRRHRTAMALAAAVMLLFSVTSLVWCPWSLHWLGYEAYKAHAAEQYVKAVQLYTRVIERDPHNAWAHLNRSYAYASLDRHDEAEADLARAREIDPDIATRE